MPGSAVIPLTPLIFFMTPLQDQSYHYDFCYFTFCFQWFGKGVRVLNHEYRTNWLNVCFEIKFYWRPLWLILLHEVGSQQVVGILRNILWSMVVKERMWFAFLSTTFSPWATMYHFVLLLYILGSSLLHFDSLFSFNCNWHFLGNWRDATTWYFDDTALGTHQEESLGPWLTAAGWCWRRRSWSLRSWRWLEKAL